MLLAAPIREHVLMRCSQRNSTIVPRIYQVLSLMLAKEGKIGISIQP